MSNAIANLRRLAVSPIRRALHALGYELRRRPATPTADFSFAEPGSTAWWRVTQDSPSQEWLRRLSIRTVIDIGAHEGAFIADALRWWPEARIHAFEPLPEMQQQLARCANNERVRLYDCALGDEVGTLVMHRNQFAPSSSLLDMAAEHIEQFPFTARQEPVTIKVETLDAVFAASQLDWPLCVKIDVQGFEDRVIRGGQGVLRQAELLIIEMSVIPLYERQQLFDEVYASLRALGFVYHGNIAQLVSPQNGAVLQMDAVFLKTRCQN